MGMVLPFEARTAAPACARSLVAERAADAAEADASEASSAGQAVLAAVRGGCDWRGVLNAAGPLLERCRDRYGFAVMRAGLPRDPVVLADALLTLARGLEDLEARLGSRRPLRTYGVYLGQSRLAWLDDGYGCAAGLALPPGVDPAELARFLSVRLDALPAELC